MTDWVVYYSDGTTFSSEQGTPDKAPRDYVQVIMQDNPRLKMRDVIDGAGTDYQFYCWHPEGDCWIIHDTNGLEQFLASNPSGIYLRGYYIPDDAFWKIHSAAIDSNWKGLPVRYVRASDWSRFS